MMGSPLKHGRKRRLLALLPLLPWAGGHSKTARAVAPDASLHRFHGISPVLVVDAIVGAKMEHVVMFDDRGVQIYASAIVAKQNREIMALGGGRVPLTVRVAWRTGAGWDKVRQVWNDGVIAGDYTILVAERIPDAVLNDIHVHGGGLRLKFRLKPDGVLFGWDIERRAPLGNVSIFEMPGGDFLDTRY